MRLKALRPTQQPTFVKYCKQAKPDTQQSNGLVNYSYMQYISDANMLGTSSSVERTLANNSTINGNNAINSSTIGVTPTFSEA